MTRIVTDSAVCKRTAVSAALSTLAFTLVSLPSLVFTWLGRLILVVLMDLDLLGSKLSYMHINASDPAYFGIYGAVELNNVLLTGSSGMANNGPASLLSPASLRPLFSFALLAHRVYL